MIDWFAVSNEIPTHPKTLHLARLLGKKEAGWYLITLYAWCSKHNHRGVFSGPDAAAQIEDAAGWRGVAGRLAEAMRVARQLDVDESSGTWTAHDWYEWNGAKMEKSESDASSKRAARDAMKARPSNYSERHTKSQRRGAETALEVPAPRREIGARAAPPDADADADDDADSNFKAPKPPESGVAPGGAARARKAPAPIEIDQKPFALDLAVAPQPLRDLDALVYSRWRELYALRAASTLDPKRRALIAKRRSEREGTPAAVQEALLTSLEGWRFDDWKDRRDHLKLSQLFRDAEQVDKGLELYERRPRPPPTKVRQPNCNFPGCAEEGDTVFCGSSLRACVKHDTQWCIFIEGPTDPTPRDAETKLDGWLASFRGKEAQCTS